MTFVIVLCNYNIKKNQIVFHLTLILFYLKPMSWDMVPLAEYFVIDQHPD